MYDPVVIENAKENVMPLKEGRYLDDLTQVLCEPKEAIHARKIEYETELEHLPESTNVELLVEKWERYIEWIKESYPTDKSLDILVPAYEGCIQELTKLTDSTGELKDLSGSSVTLKLFAGYV